MFCRQSNPLEDDSVRLDDNSVLVGQQKAREKTLFLDDQGRTTTTPIPRLMTMIAMAIYIHSTYLPSPTIFSSVAALMPWLWTGITSP